MNITVQRHFEFGEQFMIVRKDDQEFRLNRLAGGVAWPVAGRPGFLVIVGEDADPDIELDIRPMRVLVEAGDHFGTPFLALEPVLESMLEWRSRVYVPTWHGLPFPQPDVLRAFNRAQAQRKKQGLVPGEMPEPKFGPMLDLVYRRTAVHKTLHFGESAIPGRLSALPADAAQTGKFEDHPEVTALLFAVAYLESRAVVGRTVSRSAPIGDRLVGY